MRIIKSTFVMTMLTIAMTALFGCVSVDANGRDFFPEEKALSRQARLFQKLSKSHLSILFP